MPNTTQKKEWRLSEAETIRLREVNANIDATNDELSRLKKKYDNILHAKGLKHFIKCKTPFTKPHKEMTNISQNKMDFKKANFIIYNATQATDDSTRNILANMPPKKQTTSPRISQAPALSINDQINTATVAANNEPSNNHSQQTLPTP